MESSANITHEFTGCPECGAPAEISDRFVLESTDGPLEHVTVRCAARLGHRFTMLLERLRSVPLPSTPTQRSRVDGHPA